MPGVTIMKAMRLATLALLWGLPLMAQDAAPDANAREVFVHVRQHMIETILRQPNYTCLETIERSSHSAREKEFRVDDRVRLEVALVDGKEMFAWPGSKRFEDADLRTFFSSGMYGTGEFGAFARGVFGGSTTTFRIEGPQTLDGSLTTRYSFQVAVEHGMWLQGPTQRSLAGYHGSIYVAPDTLDLVRMDVQADDGLPEFLDLRTVTDSIEYGRVKIGDGDFLLPVTAETVMVSLRGEASRNRIKFSGCHEFTGESKLIFGDAGDAGDGLGDVTVKQEVRLPRNVELTVRLTADIDLDNAAIGDPMTAALYSDVKVKGKVALPKGTAVLGRIVRLERFPDFTVVGFIFQDAESGNLHAALDLTFDSSEGAYVLGRGARWGTRAPIRPHEGLLPLRSGKMRGKGAVLLWRT